MALKPPCAFPCNTKVILIAAVAPPLPSLSPSLQPSLPPVSPLPPTPRTPRTKISGLLEISVGYKEKCYKCTNKHLDIIHQKESSFLIFFAHVSVLFQIYSKVVNYTLTYMVMEESELTITISFLTYHI